MKQAELIPSISSEDWQKKKFYFPKNTINVATLFSGIGAVEHALKRLRLKSNVVFAGDKEGGRTRKTRALSAQAA